jgi:hypothetical protein
MCRHKFDVNFIVMMVFMAAFFLVIPHGHVTAQPAGSKAQSVPLPVYKKGTTFIYANGTWETVMASSPDLVTWRNHRGYVSSGSPDFTRRRTAWQTGTRQGTRQFGPRKDLWVKKETSLWPLQTGNVSSFAETSTRRRKGEPETTSRYNWACEVTGTEQVSVMAGVFDSWKIVCQRYSTKNLTARSRARESKTWYYAPEIGHYVLTIRETFSGKPARRLELLAVLPPVDVFSHTALTRMNATFQKAMEFRKSGQSSSWATPNSSFSGEITPVGTFKLADGRFSRRFVHRLKLPEGSRTYYGMAVRDSSGRWVVPRR